MLFKPTTLAAVSACFITVLFSAVECTVIHVNDGCIVVKGQGVCAPGWLDIGGGATIYAQFNGQPGFQTPGCKVAVDTPGFGDVYFGADNCLYGSKGESVNGQCCVNPTDEVIKSPY